MKQILQNMRTGQTLIAEVPAPACGPGMLKIRTRKTLISPGTERMLVEFSKDGLIAKAKAQPDKVKQVLDKIRTEGLMPTFDTVFNRLDEPLPLGYCNFGQVMEVGTGIQEFKVNDFVVSNGPHAEIVSVPKNLCAKVPEGIHEDHATFTVLGSIGLQGIRLINPALGEKIVVFGAGLIGLVMIQLLRSSGCDVLAVDLNSQRLELAAQFGARIFNSSQGNPIAAARAWTEGVGVDGAIITAHSTADDIVHQSAEMCRMRGRIVLIGVVDLNLRRSDFYKKELIFQVSCSYGPGRYDDNYERKGQDYPPGFVRWTEQRNFQAVLGAMASGQLDVSSLITDRMAMANAAKAYDKISCNPNVLGVVLEYPAEVNTSQAVLISHVSLSPPTGACIAAMVGSGNFAKMTMAPALAKTGARLKYITARSNVSASTHLATKYGFENAGSNTEEVLADPEVNAVFIATRHHSHAWLTCEALAAGKHVFVEKPLAMNVQELHSVIEAAKAVPDKQVMVGFNRRFCSYVVKIKELLSGRSEPLAMHFSCNAGIIPPNVWVHDPERGGGRIIGEACHFIDLLTFITENPVVSISAVQMGQGVAVRDDKMSIIMDFADGSVGTVNYFGNGHKAYPKETLEVYSEGRILKLDNFQQLNGWGFHGFRKMKGRLDKGHRKSFQAFVDLVASGGKPLIPMNGLINVTLASFAAMTAAAERRMIVLAEEYSGTVGM